MKKLRTSLFIFLCIFAFTLTVNAATISDLGMDITIPATYANLLDEANQDLFEEYDVDPDAFKQLCVKNNIVYDAIDADFTKELAISSMENSTTKEVINLNAISDFNSFLTEYKVAATNASYTCTKAEKFQVGELTFIHANFKAKLSSSATSVDQYYTVVNGKGITISMTYYNNTPINEEELANIVKTVSFDHIEKVETVGQNFFILSTVIGVAIGLIIVFLIRFLLSKKYGSQNDAISSEENKEVIEDKVEEKASNYTKFGGWHIFFLLTLIISTFQMVYSIYYVWTADVITNLAWFKNYSFIVILHSAISAVLLVASMLIITKRKPITLSTLKINLIVIACTITLCTIARIVLFATSMGDDNMQYYTEEAKVITQGVAYAAIWFSYLKKSERVEEYYKINN